MPRLRVALVALVVLAGALAVGSPPASTAVQPATLVVTSLADSGPGSLRQAIADAAPGDTIDFGVSGTIMLTSGELAIGKSLQLRGPAGNHVAVSAAPGGGNRVMRITAGTLTITDLTITNGHVSCCPADGVGGGILNEAGLRLVRSTVSHNVAPIGGGVYTAAGARTVIVNSTLSGNIASDPGFGCDGGGWGGALANVGGTLMIVNTTMTDNEGPCGSGLWQPSGRTELVNTIIMGNRSFFWPACEIDGGTISSLGHNLANDRSCRLRRASDLSGLDALLGPLQDNGGPTTTHALLPGNPAIDAGTTTMAPTTDQRGVARPQGPGVDIGSFEVAVAGS